MAVYSIVTSVFLLTFALVLGFLLTKYEAFIDTSGAKECGVDRPPCMGANNQCINGWCVAAIPPRVPSSTGIPVYP